MKKEEDQGQCSSQNIKTYEEQVFLQQQNSNHMNMFGRGKRLMFPEVSPILQTQPLFLVPPTTPSSLLPYTSFFNSRVPIPSSSHTFVGNPYGLIQPEYGSKISAQEMMEAKAVAASKSHSEAERRRRERINNHLAKLRTLLPNTTKTDKASLLGEVIEHVKLLKRQTSLIAETSEVPTESDELIVNGGDDQNGKFMIKASLCCEDRSDLLPDLINTLKSLRLRTLKAEITTLSGRVKNVLFVTESEDRDYSNGEEQQYACINSIQEALKAVMEKSTDESVSGNVKRQRTNNIIQYEN